jgi:hypothetical protein
MEKVAPHMELQVGVLDHRHRDTELVVTALITQVLRQTVQMERTVS